MQTEEQRRPQGVERPKTSGLAPGNALEMGVTAEGQFASLF